MMYFDQPIASSPSPFESSSFQDQESSSLQNQEPSMLRTHEDPLCSHKPTPSLSLSSSFYQQTTPPSFYQQQILTAWDWERGQTRRPQGCSKKVAPPVQGTSSYVFCLTEGDETAKTAQANWAKHPDEVWRAGCSESVGSHYSPLSQPCTEVR